MYRKIKIKKVIFYIFIILILLFLFYIVYNWKKSEGFENLEKYAFVINLEKRKDRLTQIQNDFKDAPFQLVRFNAVAMDPPQQGCASSFVNLVRMAKEKGLPTVLIFEDDNAPEPNSFENWTIIKNYLDSHMDMWEIFNGGMRNISSIQKMIDLGGGIKLIKPTGGYSNNWIYINKSVYDKILSWEALGKPLIDLWFANSFNVWCSYPFLALQHSGESDIEKNYRDFNNENSMVKNNFDRLLTSWSARNTN
jgi:hypothetical protein